jgi:hypothetical protein
VLVGCGVAAEHVLCVPPEEPVDDVDGLFEINAGQVVLLPRECAFTQPSTSDDEGRQLAR